MIFIQYTPPTLCLSLVSLITSLTAATTGGVDAFSFSFSFPTTTSKAFNPALKEIADNQNKLQLNLRLEVGREKEHRLLIDGLAIELAADKAPEGAVPLPGSSGPSAHLSSGASTLKIVDKASYIDMTGLKTLDLSDGNWEMVWRDDSAAGAFVFGFNLPDDVHRNAAIVPKGRLYMSLPVWSSDELTKKQKFKAKAEEKAIQHRADQAKQIEHYKSTNNPLMKALHFRNALMAVDKISRAGLATNGYLHQIPSPEDVLAINGDLKLCRTGTVWTKEEKWGGAEHILLGVVSLADRCN